MTRDEVKNIVMMIYYTYPNFKPDDLGMLITAWAAILEKQDAKAIEQALVNYASTSHEFAPTPGQLIDMVREMSRPKVEYISEIEAWHKVYKAICNGTYGAEAEFAKLPPEIQKAVGDPGQIRAWATTDIDSIQTVVQSNFLRSYRGVLKQVEHNNLQIGVSDNLRLGVEE